MKGTGEKLGGDEQIYSIDYEDGYAYTYLQIHQVVHIKILQLFLCQSSEAVKKKKKRIQPTALNLDQSAWIWCIWEIC